MTSPSTGKSHRHTLQKSEILRGYKVFGRVFSRGLSVKSDGIRCYYDMQREIPPYQCMVGFAVKKPGTSVKRNRLRRLLRESYRQRKAELQQFCALQEIQLRCVFLIDGGRAHEHVSFAQVDAGVAGILEALMKKLKDT